MSATGGRLLPDNPVGRCAASADLREVRLQEGSLMLFLATGNCCHVWPSGLCCDTVCSLMHGYRRFGGP